MKINLSPPRLISLIVTFMLVAGGLSYALLQSSAVKVTGSSVQTPTADLKISADGMTYSSSIPGFSFTNLIPSSPPSPSSGQNLYLKNTGSTPLALKLSVTSVPLNPANTDLSKVYIVLTPVGSNVPQPYSLQSLMNAGSGGVTTTSGALAAGATQQYKIQMSMDADAFSGASASLSNIDLSFVGVASS